MASRVAVASGALPAVVVTGATGGCGVTTLALHLALVLGRGGTACFVEGARAAGAAERLGLDREQLRTWPVADPTPESMRLSALPMADGFRALFAPPTGAVDRAVVELVTGKFARVVVDGAPSLENLSNRCVTVFVIPPSLSAVRRARPLLDHADGARVVVFNRTGSGGECTRARLEAELGVSAALELPHWPSLRAAEDGGRLLRRRSRWMRGVERLAGGIAAERTRS